MKKISLSLLLLPALLGCFTVRSAGQTPTPAAAPATAAPAPQQLDPAKVEEIHKMLELTGTLKGAQQAIDQIYAKFKSQHPEIPNDFWAKAEKQSYVQDLVTEMIPVYDKYYSLDDLKAVNAFYSSPAGRRMVAVTPQLVGESMRVAQEWGQGVGAKITEDVSKEKAAVAAAAPPPAATNAPAPTAPTPSPATDTTPTH